MAEPLLRKDSFGELKEVCPICGELIPIGFECDWHPAAPAQPVPPKVCNLCMTGIAGDSLPN